MVKLMLINLDRVLALVQAHIASERINFVTTKDEVQSLDDVYRAKKEELDEWWHAEAMQEEEEPGRSSAGAARRVQKGEGRIRCVARAAPARSAAAARGRGAGGGVLSGQGRATQGARGGSQREGGCRSEDCSRDHPC